MSVIDWMVSCSMFLICTIALTFLHLPLRINIFIMDVKRSSKTSQRNGTIGWSVWQPLRKKFSFEAINSISFSLAGISWFLITSWRIGKNFPCGCFDLGCLFKTSVNWPDHLSSINTIFFFAGPTSTVRELKILWFSYFCICVSPGCDSSSNLNKAFSNFPVFPPENLMPSLELT